MKFKMVLMRVSTRSMKNMILKHKASKKKSNIKVLMRIGKMRNSIVAKMI